jgi:hypothetical protein
LLVVIQQKRYGWPGDIWNAQFGSGLQHDGGAKDVTDLLRYRLWCLLFVLVRHGEEGATSLHAGLERLGKETGEPTGTFGSHPQRTLTSTERSLRRFKRSHRYRPTCFCLWTLLTENRHCRPENIRIDEPQVWKYTREGSVVPGGAIYAS